MNLRENWSRSKEVIGAYLRQGLHELGSVFYGPGTAAQPAEYGLLGTRTPGQVHEGIRAKPVPADRQDAQPPSLIDERLESLKERVSEKEPEREMHEPERD
ncbi:MAG: hypothetical protein ACREJD_03085 [Phycisphaerales bacterium]